MLANILPSAAVVFLLSYPTGTVGGDGDPHGRAIEAAVHLSGAGSAEEMDEEELGHFLSFAAHPLPVNNSSRARLISSGLFSPYQIASLEDYRRRNGDILSFSELLSVNGFHNRFFRFGRKPGRLFFRRLFGFLLGGVGPFGQA